MELDRIFASLLAVIGDPYIMTLMVVAVPIGMFFGAIPGLGHRGGAACATDGGRQINGSPPSLRS